MAESTDTQQQPILALVTDLFFVLKISDTAKAVGWPIIFAESAKEFLDRFQKATPALVIADLVIPGVDVAGLFEELSADAHQGAVPILGYTTHADWKRTSPLHDRCTKVVTKETLSHSLAELMQQLMPPR